MPESKQQNDTRDEKSGTFSVERVCKSNNLIKNLREVIESHPDEIAKNFGMAIVYLICDKYDKMLSCLELVAQQYPDVPLIQRRIAEIHIYRSNFQEAIPYLEKVLELEEEDMTAKIWLSLIYFVTGDIKKGKASLKSLKGFIFVLRAENTKWSENGD